MTNTSKKPVNDLIKFWAEKQDKDLEPIPRSPRRPLSPTSSVPPSPLNENFYSRSLFKDIPSNTPPLTPLHTPQNNLHSLISEEGDKNNSVDNGRSDSVSQSVSRTDTPMEETSTNNTTNNKVVNNIDVATRDYFSRKPRDHDLNIKDNKTGHLPPVRKVTDLVSKFEKVASPNNSVQNSPRLTPVKRGQTFAQSSSTSRNQFTPEPISLNLPDPLIAKAKRRQTVPEPLNISTKKFIDEPSTSSPISQNLNKNCESTPISPISPIENLPTAVPNAQPISTLNLTDTKTQTQKKQTYQEPFSKQSLKNDDDNQPKKNVSIELPVKESDPKPLQQQQQQQQELSSQPISLVQTDYLEFLSETFKNTTFDLSNKSNSANDLKYSSELGFILPEPASVKKSTTESTKGNTLAPPLLKSISEKLIHTKQSKQSNTVSRSKTFPRITNNAHVTSKNSNNFEIPDLLPQPEPISPIRLNFSDFLATPNGSTTNLNSDDKVNSEKPKKDGEKEKQNNPLIYKVVVESKSEVPKKNENSKSIRHISGSLQLFENLKRYLQPNKQKSSDDINPSTKKFTSQNFNDDNQLNQLY